MKKAKFGIGLVLGAVAGVVAGLLTAPKSGKETRDGLKKKATATKQEADAKVTELTGKARQAADDAKARAEDWKERATRAGQSAKKELTTEPEAESRREKK